MGLDGRADPPRDGPRAAAPGFGLLLPIQLRVLLQILLVSVPTAGAAELEGARVTPVAPLEADSGPALSLSPGMERISRGDHAWFTGDRPRARSAYREATRAEHPAARAMAHLRLLHFSGNLGMAVHGPRVDRALAACDAPPAGDPVEDPARAPVAPPAKDPWCILAKADFHLFAPPEVGADPARAVDLARRIRERLPGPAAARVFLATGDPEVREAMRSLPLDGLGRAVVETGRRTPPGPGTWMLGLGVAGAPGIGVGGGLRYVHPDLALRAWYLEVEGGATTRGNLALGTTLASPGRVFGILSAGGQRRWLDLYEESGEVTEQRYDLMRGAAGPGLRWGNHTLAAGGHLLRIGAGQTEAGLRQEITVDGGPWATWAWDRRRGWGGGRRGGLVSLSATSTLTALGSDHDHLGLTLDLRRFLSLPASCVLATRLLGRAALVPGIPAILLPAAGGAEILRGAPVGRYRGAGLASVDVELRRMIAGPLEGVFFGTGVWVEGTGAHPGAGAGLRLILPPRSWNAVRLDVAVSDAGWAVTTGWGEVF